MAMWTDEELSYCSNVHPGDSLSEVRDNLKRFITPVKSGRGLERLQAGLWLSHHATDELIASETSLQAFAKLLEQQGIVQRTKCEDDQRYTRIELTGKGDEIFEDLAPLAERQLERTLHGFSAEERKQLDRMMRRMKDNTYRSPYAHP